MNKERGLIVAEALIALAAVAIVIAIIVVLLTHGDEAPSDPKSVKDIPGVQQKIHTVHMDNGDICYTVGAYQGQAISCIRTNR